MQRTRDYSKNWNEIFRYDPSNKSCLVWNIEKGTGKNKVFPGKPAGALDSRGRWVVGYFGKVYLVHVVIWTMFNDLKDGLVIDHINGDHSDNRIENLRETSQSINSRNRRKSSRNTSGVTGVSYHSRDRCWSVSYTVNRKIYMERFYCKDYPDAKQKAIDRRIELENSNLIKLEFTERHGK